MEFIKKYWRILLVTLVLLLNVLVQFQAISSLFDGLVNVTTFTLVLTAIYILIEEWIKISQDKDFVEIKADIKEGKEDLKVVRESVQIVEKEIKEEKVKKDKKYKDTRLIAELINENLISIKTIEDNIGDKHFISVICYQKGFNKDTPSKWREQKIRRKYNEIFEGMDFIKLAGVYPYFIIAEENIFPEKLRGLNRLSDYLLKKAKLSLEEEWKEIMNFAKNNSTRFYNNRKNQSNPLNFNMLLTKINRRDMGHRFIKTNDFNDKFNSELASITKLNKLKIKEDEKINIRNIVLESSIKILILGINKKDREKILELEEEFKKNENEGGLNIKNFYDYQYKDETKIKQILNKKFKDEEKKGKYAKIIIENSKDYKEDLDFIGIKL